MISRPLTIPEYVTLLHRLLLGSDPARDWLEAAVAELGSRRLAGGSCRSASSRSRASSASDMRHCFVRWPHPIRRRPLPRGRNSEVRRNCEMPSRALASASGSRVLFPLASCSADGPMAEGLPPIRKRCETA